MIQLAAAMIVGGFFTVGVWLVFQAWFDASDDARERRQRKPASARCQRRMRAAQVRHYQDRAMRKLRTARSMELEYHRGNGDENTPALVERLRQEADTQKSLAEIMQRSS
jgi:hypothetical protein